MSDSIKAQFEWDTLLVAGYKGDWTLAKAYAKFMQIGYTADDFNALKRRPRGTIGRFVMKQPVSAVLANGCPEIFNILLACKEMPDFIAARNLISKSEIDFRKCKTLDWKGIGEVRKLVRDDIRDRTASNIALSAMYEGSAKAGGKLTGGVRRNRRGVPA